MKSADVQMPERRKGLIERRLPEELIVYDPATDRAFLLNRTSAVIWELCDGQSDAHEISEQLASCFNAAMENVVVDVKATLEQFQRDRLLVSG